MARTREDRARDVLPSHYTDICWGGLIGRGFSVFRVSIIFIDVFLRKKRLSDLYVSLLHCYVVFVDWYCNLFVYLYAALYSSLHLIR